MKSAELQLEQFIAESLSRELSRTEIEAALTAAGWPMAQIRTALGAYADVPFPVPVPRPRPSLSSREAFLYLVLFNALYFGAFNFGNLLFHFIDLFFPDPLDQASRTSFWNEVRWSTSAVIVTLPVIVALTHYIEGQATRNPILRLSPVRRWLTYLTLFLASTTLLGDITTLIYEVLGGELTARFAMKVIVVAAIAGTAFGYYLLDLRREEER